MSIFKLKFRVNWGNFTSVVENFLDDSLSSKNLIRFFGNTFNLKKFLLRSDVVNVVRTCWVIAFLSMHFHVSVKDSLKIIVVSPFKNFP